MTLERIVLIALTTATWDELGDLVATKARSIAFDTLTAQPYVDAVRDVVAVYRGGVDARS